MFSMRDVERPDDRSVAGLIVALRAELHGVVITPECPEYDRSRRVWNARFDDRRPAAVLRCADEDDVVRAIRRLRDVERPVAVRGGGHHVAGFGSCDGGFIIDLRAMRGATAGGGPGHVLVQGGATVHDMDVATSSGGRAVPLGVVSGLGVGGLTLGGGIGWLTRRHGYTCDSLVSARVVTAAGSVLIASRDQNSDLFWGLRGGGGNFGVATEFEFATHPVDEVVFCEAYHAIGTEAEVERLLRFFRAWSEELPTHTTAWLVIERGSQPGAVDVASDHVGLSLFGCCVAPSQVGRSRLSWMAREGGPVAARVSSMRLRDLHVRGRGTAAAARGTRRYMRSEMLSELTDDAIAHVAHYALRMPPGGSRFELATVGGAIADHHDLEAAVGLRDARYFGGFMTSNADCEYLHATMAWTREAASTLSSGSAGGGSLNFDSDATEERVLASLGAIPGRAKEQQLVALKHRYDPGNFFRLNHNIEPRLGPPSQQTLIGGSGEHGAGSGTGTI